MSTNDPKVEANKAVMRRFYEEFWNKGNEAVADVIVADNLVHDQLPPDWPAGREGFKRLVRTLRQSFPDMAEEVELLIGEGDWVAGRFRLTGTHRGDLYGIQPTGRRVDIRGLDLVRIVDGRIVEWIYHEDTLGLFGQIGVMPADFSKVAGSLQKRP